MKFIKQRELTESLLSCSRLIIAATAAAADKFNTISDGSSGPVILQIIPSDATEDMGELYTNPSPSGAKRRKIVHLVTSIPGTSSQQMTVAKVIGQVRTCHLNYFVAAVVGGFDSHVILL